LNAQNAERTQANLRVEHERQIQASESRARCFTFLKLGAAQLATVTGEDEFQKGLWLAEESFSAALKETAHFKPDNFTLLKIRAALGRTYLLERRSGIAIPLFEGNNELSEKLFGATNPKMSRSLVNLAVSYDRAGKVAEAERLFKRNLAIWQSTSPACEDCLETSLENLATFYMENGRLKEAQPYLVRIVAFMEKQNEPYMEPLLDRMDKLAESYFPENFEKTESVLLRRMAHVHDVPRYQYDASQQLAQMYIHRKMFKKALGMAKIMEKSTAEVVQTSYSRIEKSQTYEYTGEICKNAGNINAGRKYFRLAQLELTKPELPVVLEGSSWAAPDSLTPYSSYHFTKPF